jgi:hypothetical protein
MDFLGICILGGMTFMGGVIVGLAICLLEEFRGYRLGYKPVLLILGMFMGIFSAGFIFSAFKIYNLWLLLIGEAFAIGAIVSSLRSFVKTEKEKIKLRKGDEKDG